MSNDNNNEEATFEDEFTGPINAKAFENDEWDLDTEDLEKYTKPIKKKDTKLIKDSAPKIKAITGKIPAKFLCSLTQKIMTEPTRIAGSKFPAAYEKSALYAHYEEFGTDPKTGDYLDDDIDFTADLALAREIADFCQRA